MVDTIVVIVALLIVFVLRSLSSALAGFVGLSILLGYGIYFEGSASGQTPGKRLLGIRVVSSQNSGPIGYGGAFVRWIGKAVSSFFFCLGYLWVLWDAEKQGWHDKIASTVVVYERDYPVERWPDGALERYLRERQNLRPGGEGFAQPIRGRASADGVSAVEGSDGEKVGPPAAVPVVLALPDTARTNILVAGKPLEVWFPVGLFAVAGIYLLQLCLRALPDSFRLFTINFFPHALAFVLLVVVVLVGLLGAALGAIAWLCLRADRVGRGLAYVASASLFAVVVFGQGATGGEVWSMLAGLAAAAILGFAPAVREHFTGPEAPQRDQPTSIVVARVSLAIWLALLAVAAVLDFCLATIQGKYAAYGVLLVLVAVGGLRVFRRLDGPDRQARLIVSAAAGLALVLLLLGRHDPGLVLLLGLTASIPACLWLPPDARSFYGDAPLVVVRQPQ